MTVNLPPGIYVVAVSGGVDSVVLLDLLVAMSGRKHGYRLVVAHFDHGIRPDSPLDRRFVAKLAAKKHIPFVFDEGKLGAGASEATARKARYAFLRKVARAAGASGIITAHHQDDMLETAIINLLRGTGRLGLSSLRSGPEIIRPLLSMSKDGILLYAKRHKLIWREDSTNSDLRYLRNYVRAHVVPRFSEAERQDLLDRLHNFNELNKQINKLLEAELGVHCLANQLDRLWFLSLSHAVSKEVIASWLRANGQSFDTPLLERVVAQSKTRRPGKKIDISNGCSMVIGKDHLALELPER